MDELPTSFQTTKKSYEHKSNKGKDNHPNKTQQSKRFRTENRNHYGQQSRQIPQRWQPKFGNSMNHPPGNFFKQSFLEDPWLHLVHPENVASIHKPKGEVRSLFRNSFFEDPWAEFMNHTTLRA